MPAYAKTYLMDAMENMGEMADFAAIAFDMDIAEFWSLFAATKYAREFEMGLACTVVGISGSDLALRVGECIGIRPKVPIETCEDIARISNIQYMLSPEYWCGWALAYYQWKSERSFGNINRYLAFDDVLDMYPLFHEMSEERFAEAADERAACFEQVSRLKMQRGIVGLSQSELARASGVGIRAIQQYEQRSKNINKASISRVMALAKALHCEPKDILEPISAIDYAVVEV